MRLELTNTAVTTHRLVDSELALSERSIDHCTTTLADASFQLICLSIFGLPDLLSVNHFKSALITALFGARMPMSLRSSTASPDPNEQYPSTANEFPRQAGKTITASKAGNRIVSPTPSSFSFDPEDSGSNGISFTPDLIEQKKISRNVMRGAPGDQALMAMVKRDQEGTNLSRRKSQFYGEVFAYRESNISARNKVHQYSVITAEVKTNVIVRPLDRDRSRRPTNCGPRSKTNTFYSPTSPSTSPSATNARRPRSSSPSLTPPASSTPAPLNRPTS